MDIIAPSQEHAAQPAFQDKRYSILPSQSGRVLRGGIVKKQFTPSAGRSLKNKAVKHIQMKKTWQITFPQLKEFFKENAVLGQL